MSNFSTSLLSANPKIIGLDQSIIIPSRRLHFTLGVMALERAALASSVPASTTPTVEAAIAFLHGLKPEVDNILERTRSEDEDNTKLRVTLDVMDVMKSEKDDMAHVVWIGPQDGNSKTISNWQTKRLREVAGKSRFFCS